MAVKAYLTGLPLDPFADPRGGGAATTRPSSIPTIRRPAIRPIAEVAERDLEAAAFDAAYREAGGLDEIDRDGLGRAERDRELGAVGAHEAMQQLGAAVELDQGVAARSRVPLSFRCSERRSPAGQLRCNFGRSIIRISPPVHRPRPTQSGNIGLSSAAVDQP